MSDDLVNRQFTVDGPDRLWVSDITEHAAEGKEVRHRRPRRLEPPSRGLVHR